jgi:hypothetical protein
MNSKAFCDHSLIVIRLKEMALAIHGHLQAARAREGLHRLGLQVDAAPLVGLVAAIVAVAYRRNTS